VSDINKQPVDVFLVSSTLHFFWAFMLASQNKAERQSHLIVIDQYADKPLLMLEFMSDQISPFASIEVLEGRELKGRQKLENRRQQFLWAEGFIEKTVIERIFIGNDRSVFGQFFIKQAKANDIKTSACYLDDGVFTYLGREASKSWGEKYLDRVFKKLAYGFWYDVPATVGASKWIDQLWVMYPELVNKDLKLKQKTEILSESRGFEQLKPLSEQVMNQLGISLAELSSLDVLITLPNETVFSKIDDYQEKMMMLLSCLIEQQKKVAIKYHPAAGERDILGLESQGAVKLPSNVSFELFIPLLNDCLVIGDFSTTVLMAKYSHRISVIMVNTSADEEMSALCEAVGIDVMGVDSVLEMFRNS